ncbi:hypothetical protein INR49_018296, partial [Caranx melampygus]
MLTKMRSMKTPWTASTAALSSQSSCTQQGAPSWQLLQPGQHGRQMGMFGCDAPAGLSTRSHPDQTGPCIVAFTSMLVRLHWCVSANQLSPVAHWSKSMSWMLTSTRITPLTQKEGEDTQETGSVSSSSSIIHHCWEACGAICLSLSIITALLLLSGCGRWFLPSCCSR